MNLQDFHSNPEVTAAIEKAVQETLKQIGEDPAREGLGSASVSLQRIQRGSGGYPPFCAF